MKMIMQHKEISKYAYSFFFLRLQDTFTTFNYRTMPLKKKKLRF